MKLVLSLSILLLVTSCAQYRLHKGSYAKQVNSKNEKTKKWNKRGETDIGLRISSQIDSKLSSKYFGMINFIFENKTDKWIRIEKAYLKFSHPEINKNVRFVSGNQLNYFLDAVNDMNKEKAKIKAQNQAAWAAVAAGAAAASSSSSQYNTYTGVNFLNGMLLGAVVSMNISQFEQSTAKDNKKLFPKGHLFHKDFVIPPGLFSKKWILLNTTNHETIGRLSEAVLTYVTSDGKKETVAVGLKGYSQWQKDVSSKKQLGMK